MGRFRARSSCVSIAVALTVVVASGQSADDRHVIIQNLGLPAIDEGVIADDTHAPGTVEALRRARLRAVLGDEAGPATARYARGRLIVKFRDDASDGARLAAVTRISGAATIDARPTYADFDIVRIDPAQDAEAAAIALEQRAEVEYAQPAYKVHTMLVPNDPLYATRQWNLPLINLERAWDIQPQAGSSIVVAVLDTGVAYQNATLIENIPVFTDDRGVRYPALGRVTVPYAGATQLMASGRF